MAEPADRWLERDGVSLHCLEWSPEPTGAQPPILLLHGLSSNAQYWGRIARQLKHRRVIALDQRGHGLTGRPPHSPALPAGFAMEALLEDINHTIKVLELGRPVLVGHSWGATIALEFAARNPVAASALVFVDGPAQSAANLFSCHSLATRPSLRLSMTAAPTLKAPGVMTSNRSSSPGSCRKASPWCSPSPHP